jgi:hypothetical protein
VPELEIQSARQARIGSEGPALGIFSIFKSPLNDKREAVRRFPLIIKPTCSNFPLCDGTVVFSFLMLSLAVLTACSRASVQDNPNANQKIIFAAAYSVKGCQAMMNAAAGGDVRLYVVRTFETKRCGKEERTEPSGWGSGDRLLMQSPS